MDHNQQYVQVRVDKCRTADLHREPNKWLSTLLPAPKTGRVLDIACGMGYDSIAWARTGKKVVAIDYSQGLLRQAARLAHEEGFDNIAFVACDATRLPFREGSFDVGYSENLFEHVPQWQEIGREAGRVLAAGGLFFVRTTNRYCPRNPEIRNLHFYPLLPVAIQRPILRWVIRHHPDWVGHTAFPAVNWFTHRGLSGFFKRLGFESYEIFDLIRRDMLSPSKRKFFAVLEILKKHPALRYFVYPLLPTVQILAIKTDAVKGER
jgi:ubiquinone/menaquinone biosynthesis C-methylase UbiE